MSTYCRGLLWGVSSVMSIKHVLNAQQTLAIMIMFSKSPLDPGLYKSELERSGLRPKVLSSMKPSGLLQRDLHE